jgi:Domain of unknown function (DUF4160)
MCYSAFVPCIARKNDCKAVIYTNDHRPHHVHVIGPDHEAVFELNCPNGPIGLRENYGFNRAKLTGIAKWLVSILTELCEGWEEIHGDTN